MQGVYYGVHDQTKIRRNDELHTPLKPKNKARYKQVKARWIFAQGVYIDVHDQTKIRRNDELRRIFFVFSYGRRPLPPCNVIVSPVI